MTKPLALTVASATLLGLAAFGAAQVTKVGNGYDIKVRYQAGKTYNFALATAVTMQSGPGGKPAAQNIRIGLNQKCTGVQNGVATLVVSSTGGPGGATKPQTVKVDSRGKIVSGAPSQFTFLNGFPARPLKVGETWRSTTAFPMGPAGSGKANVAYTFRGLKSVGGRQVAQIDYAVTMAGGIAMSGRGSSFLDARDGQLTSSSLTGGMTINPAAMGARPQPGRPAPAPMKMGLKVDMKRV